MFDFDGVIADTEGPEYRAWVDTWAEYGHELTLEEWVQCIGTNDPDGWHPLTALAARIGDGFDADAANRSVRPSWASSTGTQSSPELEAIAVANPAASAWSRRSTIPGRGSASARITGWWRA